MLLAAVVPCGHRRANANARAGKVSGRLPEPAARPRCDTGPPVWLPAGMGIVAAVPTPVGPAKGDTMTTVDRYPVGAPCWADLWTSDIEGTRSFYADLFGWEAQEQNPEFGGYFMFTRDGVPVAGGMPAPADGTKQ